MRLRALQTKLRIVGWPALAQSARLAGWKGGKLSWRQLEVALLLAYHRMGCHVLYGKATYRWNPKQGKSDPGS